MEEKRLFRVTLRVKGPKKRKFYVNVLSLKCGTVFGYMFMRFLEMKCVCWWRLSTFCHDRFIASVGACVEKRLGETTKKFRKSREGVVNFFSIIIYYEGKGRRVCFYYISLIYSG